MVSREEKELIEDLKSEGITPKKTTSSGVFIEEQFKPTARKLTRGTQRISAKSGRIVSQESRKLGQGVRRFQRELYPVKKQKTLTVAQVRRLIQQGAQQERFQQKIPMQRFQQVQPQQVQQQQFQQPALVRPRVNQMQQEKPQIHNFFAHKTEMEIYGDEGLTFFDSNKARRSEGRTGSLFGI